MRGAMASLAVAALAAALALGGCGKKGNPRPPAAAEVTVPEAAPEAENEALPGEPTW